MFCSAEASRGVCECRIQFAKVAGVKSEISVGFSPAVRLGGAVGVIKVYEIGGQFVAQGEFVGRSNPCGVDKAFVEKPACHAGFSVMEHGEMISRMNAGAFIAANTRT